MIKPKPGVVFKGREKQTREGQAKSAADVTPLEQMVQYLKFNLAWALARSVNMLGSRGAGAVPCAGTLQAQNNRVFMLQHCSVWPVDAGGSPPALI